MCLGNQQHLFCMSYIFLPVTTHRLADVRGSFINFEKFFNTSLFNYKKLLIVLKVYTDVKNVSIYYCGDICSFLLVSLQYALLNSKLNLSANL